MKQRKNDKQTIDRCYLMYGNLLSQENYSGCRRFQWTGCCIWKQ